MQLKLSVLPEGLHVFRGEAGSLPPVIFLNGHTKRSTSFTPFGRFHTTTMKHPGPWSQACTKPIVNITRWFLHQFPITASTCSYIDVCGMKCTPIHILRYMGQKSNNNKMLNNNLSCFFSIRVIYTRITVTWDIRYIYEDFLIWIIPSTYQSYDVVN